MLKDLGLNWVILGHSERRHILKESDEVRTLCCLQRAGLGPGGCSCLMGRLKRRSKRGRIRELLAMSCPPT